jgi:membrane-associated protein
MQFLHALLHFDEFLAMGQHGPLVYAVLFAIIFSEMALLLLFFLPGDPLLFIGGALCATGVIDIAILMPLLFTAAVLGSVVNYGFGRMFGRTRWVRQSRWLNQAALQRTRAFYEKHGAVTFLLSPFIAVVRTFAPFVAGMAGMTVRKFVLFTLAGDAIWIATLAPGGYFFGHIPLVRDHLTMIVLLGVGVVALAGLAGALWRALKRPAH